ncbi:hypothetical protein SDC9_157114 [bioreactor metagenome]|uniref:Uncharacterized protein n=1 Tax=bioreactor metagenome TaxID=1076179 RepID=A0A645F8F7_9ZZZZ
MAVVMDPPLILRAVEDVLATVVVGLYRKGLLLLVERHLVVVHGNLEIFAGNTFGHDDLCQSVYCFSGIEDIVYQQNLITGSQMLR